MLTRPCFRFPLPCGAGVDRQREAKEKKEAEEKARKEVRVVVLLQRPPLRPTARIGCGAFRLPSIPPFLNFRFRVLDSPSGTLALTRSPVLFFAEGRSRSERGTVTRRTFSATKLSLTPRTHAHALRRGKKGRRKRYEMIVTKSRTMLDLPYDRAHASCTLHTQKLEKELLLQQQQQQQQLQKKDPRAKAKRREAKLAAVAVAAADSSCSMPASDASTSPSESENTSGADADTEENITSEEEAEKASKPSEKWVAVKAEQEPLQPPQAPVPTGSEPQAPGAWEPEPHADANADADADASPSA